MPFPLSDDRDRLLDYIQSNPVTGVDDTEALFGETLSAGFRQVMNEERTDSRARAFRPHYESRAQTIHELGGNLNNAREFILHESTGFLPYAEQLLDSVGAEEAARRTSNPALIDGIIQQREFERRFPGQVLTEAEIGGIVAKDLSAQRTINQSLIARGPGSANFIGAAAGLVTDPLILTTLPFGPGPQLSRSLLTNAARGFLGEAAVAFATEIPVQAAVLDFKAEIDSPWTFADAAFNVVAATIGAGALRATGSITIDAVAPLLKKYRKTPVSARTDESEAAAAILVRLMEAQQDSPLLALQRNLEGADQLDPIQVQAIVDTHARAMDLGRAQAEAGNPVDVAETVRGLEPLNEVDAAGRLGLDDVETFEPGDLGVDAKRFQFKEGGNAEGVTSTLADVTRFDRSLAGQVLVFEDLSGGRFVVDGHQRVALAKRALAAGQDPAEVRLSGFILREADGVTDVDAMRIGAVRNLTASTGTALDAAKVLRGIGPAGAALLPPLPPNSVLLRQGRFLARLGDDAFNATVNAVVPARQAAHVGELIAGDAEQLAALQILARLKPANEVQARAMVEQIRTAGFERKVTEDLFGEREVAESLIRERAQVIDATLRTAKADRATFGQLVSRGTSIEDVGGNRLDSGANKTKVDESGQAIEIITRLANQKGPLSDAITQAAKEVAGGAKPADTIGPILEAAGRAPDISDPGRGTPGVIRAGNDAERPGATARFIEDSPPELDQALAGAAERQTQLGDDLRALGIDIIDPGPKAADRAASKMDRKSYKDAREMTDIVRFAALGDDADTIIDGLAQKYQVLDEGETVTDLGYRAQRILVKFETGHTAEVQITDPGMWAAKTKEGGDALYDAWRALKGKGLEQSEEAIKLAAQSRALYSKASEVSASGKAAAKSASDTGVPDSITSKAATSDQASSPRNIAAARNLPSESSTTAGRPSQDINLTGDSISSDLAAGKAGRPDEGNATGFVPDDEYETVLEAYALLDSEAGEMVQLPTIRVDDAGQQVVEARSARQVMQELETQEQALRDIEVCA